MTIYKLKPGSSEARLKGCSCPIEDNASGKGWLGGVIDAKGETIFVTSGNCPLHGFSVKDELEIENEKKPLTRGWEVVLEDGTILNENDCSWKDIKKTKIKQLSLLFDGRKWTLQDKVAYIVRNRASMHPGDASSSRIEQRSIGYYEGNMKIFYSVNEFTGEFKMFVE